METKEMMAEQVIGMINLLRRLIPEVEQYKLPFLSNPDDQLRNELGKMREESVAFALVMVMGAAVKALRVAYLPQQDPFCMPPGIILLMPMEEEEEKTPQPLSGKTPFEPIELTDKPVDIKVPKKTTLKVERIDS